jgi:hypothetical protein
MTEQKRKPNEPHDQFIKQFVPVVLKNGSSLVGMLITG